MKIIDLRSDTVTLPSDSMKKAISSSPLGDDVFGEDPTVNALQERAAQITGKEAALFVPSGTMGNLVSILSQCARGTEIILGDQSHTFLYEGGGVSIYGGIHSRQLRNQRDGTLDLADIKNAIRTKDDHFPETGMICLENTHNRCFGAPLSISYMNSVSNIAKEHHLKIHVDGARIFNAAASLNTSVKKLVSVANSVSFCLSKGLSAPVGSLVCGSQKFIAKARRIRKSLGGGMRQTGIVAAAGLEALDTMSERLKDDHKNAGKLAEGIQNIAGLFLNLNNIHTNIVYFEMKTDNGKTFVERMAGNGVLFFQTSPGRFRMVTHYGITSEDIDRVLKLLEDELS
ncbi:MAG TPA: low-specificity L-threonine aldolase [Candidatus Marinimicrobia bacterium]|nr:low-specificity L-threonine aldolase [Candidatus Neomarinimicrobiota bacterium]MDP6260432.1 low-specificity L-threonine aldolase [Candidatus Neomarinimicrobiota bacterium]MDP7126309.1 low-specificity L-threonine aldolase [Candidatus Neomarinimicrobiota bacterium]MDP7337427.1 low-specificity L-threonine aldolase [Candidatus Neomarinimicrobiota bacterium]MDP7475859.1 low-specificity L-threonine aldolase [Candidatus Neomarinimicrobiota bacterium]